MTWGMDPRDSWSDAETTALVKGYDAGDSFGVISKAIRTKSRNACIGKAHRLVDAGKLKARGDAVRKHNEALHHSSGRTRLRRTVKPPKPNNDAPRPPKVQVRYDDSVPLSARPWLTREKNECRWPIGEPTADMLMCCAKAEIGEYCFPHAVRMGKTA